MRMGITLSAASIAAVTAGAAAAPIEVLLSSVEDHPTSMVPGEPDLVFRFPLAPFTSLYGSPDGSRWILKAFGDDGIDTAVNLIIVGGPGGMETVAREGEATPDAGTVIEFVDSDCGINDAGDFAYGARTAGGPDATDEVVIASDGKAQLIAVQEGDAAPGLVDPGGAKGDEIYGNSLNSVHVLNDGTIGYRADLIDNVDSDFESALYQGAFPVLQEGTMVDGVTIDSTAAIAETVFQSDAFGENWITEADINPDFLTTDEAVIVNSTVMFSDGDFLGELTSPVDAVFGINMGGGGDWMARGENADESGWIVRNDALLVVEGDPVPDADDNYGDGAGSSFFALDSNISGDYVFGAVTDNADPGLDEIIVFNNEKVVLRKGDPVDLNGNGEDDDDAFVADIDANYIFLSDDFFEDTEDTRMVYFKGEIRNGAGVSLGDAVMRRLVNDPVPIGDPADLDGDGSVGPADLALLLGAWGPCDDPRDCPEDLDGDGNVGPADLALLLGSWGPVG